MIFLDLAMEEEENDEEEENVESDNDDLVAGLFQPKKDVLKNKKNALYHNRDCSRVGISENNKEILNVAVEKIKELIKDCFVTGKWASEQDAQKLLEEDGTMKVFFYFWSSLPCYYVWLAIMPFSLL